MNPIETVRDDRTPATQDDPRLTAALEEYRALLEAGRQPNRTEFLARHGELGETLLECLAGLELVHGLAPALSGDAAGALAAETDLALAEPLGDFRLLREIGRGGMGIVYEAEQISQSCRVALKVLPFAAALDPRQLQRFRNEAAAAANLHHDHIVPVLGVGTARGVHFYTMPYIEGQTLAAIIEELRAFEDRDRTPEPQPANDTPRLPAMSQADVHDVATVVMATPPVTALTKDGSIRTPAFFQSVARLGFEAADALAHAHHIGITHRDIKPANLIVDGQGSLWITDFGLAQISGDTRLTLTGDLVGTLRYMSPEQALGRRDLDHRTDIYSLGVTLYELLTLQPAFRGKDHHDLLRQIAVDVPPAPRLLNAAIPADLEAIVQKAMAKDLRDRYGTMAEMAADLRAFLKDEPVWVQTESRLSQLIRTARQRPGAAVLAASIALTPLLIALLMAVFSASAPEPKNPSIHGAEALAPLLRDLAAGKKVTLIGEKGLPAYYRWHCDPAIARLSQGTEAMSTVLYPELGLLELLPDPMADCFRFEGSVRHDGGDRRLSSVGFYVGHGQHSNTEGTEHYYAAVTFNELMNFSAGDSRFATKGNYIQLILHRHPPTTTMYHSSSEVPGPFTIFTPQPPPAVGSSQVWHKIAIEMRPERIDVFWDDQHIGTAPRAAINRCKQSLGSPDNPLTADPSFGPHGGLGLIVIQGSASFRNVTVEPLHDK
jgi:serine/threonine protein kinase